MGTPITGREFIIGLKKAATWGTAVACGANDGLLVLSESFSQKIEEHLDDSAGLPFIQRTDKGKVEAAGGLEGYMRYEGLDVLIALIMGTAGTPTLLDTTAYSNAYKLADTLIGLFATLAMLKKSDKVFEYPSVKLHGFKLSGEMNAPVKVSASGIADQLELASTTNTNTTMANVTYPDKGNRVLWNSNAHFWLNDKSGSALQSSDAIYPASFELSFNRPVAGDYVAESTTIDEPAGTGFPEATLTLNFPRYNDANHAFFSDWEAFTEKKMEIYFKGLLIETTYYYEFKVSIPHCRVQNPEAAMSGPGKIPYKLSFRLLGTDTAPAGMTGITKPFQVDVQNTRSTDPLA